MTDVLLAYVKNNAFDSSGTGNELLEMYNKLILKMNDKLAPLKYAVITIQCARQFESIEDAITFLEEAKVRLRLRGDAIKMLDIAQADKKLALGRHHDCFEQLSLIREEIEQLSDVDAQVFSSLAHVYSLYYKRKDDHENYYKSCLQYLAYTDSAEMEEAEKKELSIKMGMSIMLGKKVFNLSELLDKDIIHILVGTDFEWMFHMMKSLGTGNINEFNRIVQQYQEFISRFPNIVNEMTYLEQKVRIIAFLELIFELGKDERSIPFDRIAQTCQIESQDVELLVMKAMSLDLIRGTINEVDQVVHVDWSQPRYLSKNHLTIMANKINAWQDKLEQTIRLVENNSDELIKA
jgi:26S proteasome regulatory subunit N9